MSGYMDSKSTLVAGTGAWTGHNAVEAGGSGGAQAAFEQAARKTPAKVKVTQGFETWEAAAIHALETANPPSIKTNIERGGNFYRYIQRGKVRYGHTDSIPGTKYKFYQDDPAVWPPAGTEWAGYFHTHGAYQEFDPNTGSPTANALRDDGFSLPDLDNQTNLVHGWSKVSGEQLVQWITNKYGAPPVPIEDLQFALGCPSGQFLAHAPGVDASPGGTMAAKNPNTGQPIPNGGTVRVLRSGR